MHFSHRFLTIFFILLFSINATCSANTSGLSKTDKAWLREHPSIKIGIDPNYGPYSFLDSSGHIKGIALDFIHKIEKKLDVEFEIISNLSWLELLEAIKEKRIDVLATVMNTPKRNTFLEFSHTYLPTPLVIMTRDTTAQIQKLTELQKLYTVLVEGYGSSEKLIEKFPMLNPRYVKTPLDALSSVSSGATDAYISVLGVGVFEAARNNLTNLKVNASFETHTTVQGYGVRKDWPQLVHILDNALLGISAQEKEQIFQNWQLPDISTLKKVTPPDFWERNSILFFIGFSGMLMITLILSIRNYEIKNQLKVRKDQLERAENIAHLGVWSFNIKSGFLEFSDELFHIAGRDRMNNMSWNVLREWIDPSGRKIHDKNLELLLKAKPGEPLPVFTSHLIRPDGESRWIEIASTVEYNSKDEPAYFYGTAQDITEKKLIENTLYEAQELFRLFMLHMPHVVVIKDETGKILFANKKAFDLLGKDLLGTTVDENLDPQSSKKILDMHKSVKEQGQVEQILHPIFDGKKYTARVLAFPISQNNGDVYIGMIYSDITKEVEQFEELKNKEEIMLAQAHSASMGEMISMIAHQWRQPLSVISMGANNIRIDIELDTVTNGALLEFTSEITEQTQYLSQTIDDFRNFFKPDTQKSETSLSHAADLSLALMGKSLENSGIGIQIMNTSTTKIVTYEHKLMQIYINLIKNAREVLLERQIKNPQITVLYDEDDNYVWSTICDNAGGIDEEIMPKIFQAYFSTKESQNGTGLGLYMSQVIAQKHLDGDLSVSNNEWGACFTIKIKK